MTGEPIMRILFLARCYDIVEEPEELAARGHMPALFIFLAETSALGSGGRWGRSAGVGGGGSSRR